MTRAEDLPVELAPSLRAAAEQLLAECAPARAPDWRRRRQPDYRCHVCHRTGGRFTQHHQVPGDNTSLVNVHPSCHRKLHRNGR